MYTGFTFLKAACNFLFRQAFHILGLPAKPMILCDSLNIASRNISYILMGPLSKVQARKKPIRVMEFYYFQEAVLLIPRSLYHILCFYLQKCTIRELEQSQFHFNILSVFFQQILLRELYIWKIKMRSCRNKRSLHCPSSTGPLCQLRFLSTTFREQFSLQKDFASAPLNPGCCFALILLNSYTKTRESLMCLAGNERTLVKLQKTQEGKKKPSVKYLTAGCLLDLIGISIKKI